MARDDSIAAAGTGGPAGIPGPATRQDASYCDWDSIYLDSAGWIHRLIFARVGNLEAEDLTAEVFAAALRSLRLPAAKPEVRAYLSLTARSVLAAHWRRVLGLVMAWADIEEMAAPAIGQPGSDHAADMVAAILTQLPDRYRRVLELRFLRSYSIRETAAELGTSTGNVKVLQHLALRLAAELANHEPGQTAPGGRDRQGQGVVGFRTAWLATPSKP